MIGKGSDFRGCVIFVLYTVAKAEGRGMRANVCHLETSFIPQTIALISAFTIHSFFSIAKYFYVVVRIRAHDHIVRIPIFLLPLTAYFFFQH